MKKQLTTIAFLLLSLAGFSQTQKGFHIIGSVGTNNVSRDQRLLINVAPEVGYFGNVFGASVVYNSIVNLYKDSKVKHHNPKGQATSVGLKIHAKVFRVDALHFFVNAEADRYIERIDKKINGDFEYRAGATVALPLVKGVDARFSPYALIYEQGHEWKHKFGGQFGIALKL